jgi:hypothetical protein
MIRVSASGSTAKMDKFLANAAKTNTIESRIRSVCEAGVRALSAATPADSGATAAAWSFEIVNKGGTIEIYWTNSHQNQGAYIAVLFSTATERVPADTSPVGTSSIRPCGRYLTRLLTTRGRR